MEIKESKIHIKLFTRVSDESDYMLLLESTPTREEVTHVAMRFRKRNINIRTDDIGLTLIRHCMHLLSGTTSQGRELVIALYGFVGLNLYESQNPLHGVFEVLVSSDRVTLKWNDNN